MLITHHSRTNPLQTWHITLFGPSAFQWYLVSIDLWYPSTNSPRISIDVCSFLEGSTAPHIGNTSSSQCVKLLPMGFHTRNPHEEVFIYLFGPRQTLPKRPYSEQVFKDQTQIDSLKLTDRPWRPSRKERSLPTIHLQVRTLCFRERRCATQMA